MASEFKFFKGLEWCVELPSINCPRESPIFLVNDTECLFRFVLEKKSPGTWYYYFYLELRSNDTEFKPFTGKLQVGFKKDRILSLDKRDFTISERDRKVIWGTAVNDLKPKLPSDYLDGNWIKYLFFIDDNVGSVFRINEGLDDKSVQTSPSNDTKSVQTPSYIDANVLLGGVSKDLSVLLDEGPNYDVEFICGEDTIKAHKNVLSCRSEVFASMLRTDMVEGNTGQVKIQDVESAIFKQFLRYLYTGVLPELTVDAALRFYETADKYAVDALKKQCTSFLLENLSLDNACEVLIIADQHDDSDFKKNVVEYMVKVKIPRMGEKWSEFCKKNPSLANEVYGLLFQHFCLE